MPPPQLSYSHPLTMPRTNYFYIVNMTDINTVRKIAMGLPEATEEPHFEKTSFRVGKKIFATCNEPEHRACVKLNEVDQDVFCSFDKNIIYPVPNKWGKQGWTLINLDMIHPDMLADALITSYCTVAPKKLAAQINEQRNNI